MQYQVDLFLTCQKLIKVLPSLLYFGFDYLQTFHAWIIDHEKAYKNFTRSGDKRVKSNARDLCESRETFRNWETALVLPAWVLIFLPETACTNGAGVPNGLTELRPSIYILQESVVVFKRAALKTELFVAEKRERERDRKSEKKRKRKRLWVRSGGFRSPLSRFPFGGNLSSRSSGRRVWIRSLSKRSLAHFGSRAGGRRSLRERNKFTRDAFFHFSLSFCRWNLANDGLLVGHSRFAHSLSFSLSFFHIISSRLRFLSIFLPPRFPW